MGWLTDVYDLGSWLFQDEVKPYLQSGFGSSFTAGGPPGTVGVGASWLTQQVLSRAGAYLSSNAAQVLETILAQQPMIAAAMITSPDEFSRWMQDFQRMVDNQAKAQQQQQQAGAQTTTGQPAVPTPPGYTRGQIPGNIDPSVVDAVLRAARDTGVPYQLALAIANQESGFNPNARHISSTEDSWGVFQLNTLGGEGSGQPTYVLQDPYQNAKIALTRVAQVLQQNPGMSWGMVAATAQNPSDHTGYAANINDFVNQIDSGTGEMGWGLSTIRAGDPTFQNNPQYGASPVPMPFAAGYFQDVSQSFGVNGEQGTDFAMPQGQNIYTPVGGTITTVDDGKGNWGKAVYVKTANGWTYFVGHLHQFTVQNGETVGPGDMLGLSGGNPNDPSSGVSTGDHVEIRFIDPAGRNQDPMTYLRPIFSGTGVNFQQWAGGMFSGDATPAPFKQNLVPTGDGQIVDLNTTEGAWWKSVDSLWSAAYGTHAPLQAAMDFQAAGITTSTAVQNAINNMPSSVPGYTIGQYNNVSDLANKAANTAFGRSVPQSLIASFLNQGMTTPGDMQLWFDQHSSSDIPTADYQAIYDAMLPSTRALSNDVPHPSDVSSVYNQINNTPYTP